MDVDQQTHDPRSPGDISILVLQEQQHLADKQEFIVVQTQALVNGQKEIQRAVQHLQSISPAARKRKCAHAHPTSDSPDDDADDEDEDEDEDRADEARARKRKEKLPPLFHVMHIFISHHLQPLTSHTGNN